jgi:hypothetical protein
MNMDPILYYMDVGYDTGLVQIVIKMAELPQR